MYQCLPAALFTKDVQ